MRNCLLVLVAALTLGFAPAPFSQPVRPQRSKDDLKRMQGSWIFTDKEWGGNPRQAVPYERVLVIMDTHALVYGSEGMVLTEWDFNLHRTTQPRGIDLYLSPKDKPKVILGIYRLEGDTFTLCITHEQSVRPTSFTGEGRGELYFFRRKKP